MDELNTDHTEDLTQILEVINAKGDTGELEEIVETPRQNVRYQQFKK